MNLTDSNPDPLAVVLDVGLATSQDLGRFGLQSVGVPTAGAMHRHRYRATAMLIGAADPLREPPGPAVVEIMSGVLALRALSECRCVVVGTANVRVSEHGAPSGTVFEVRRDEILRIEPGSPGPVYLGIDGWLPRPVLSSCSYDTFSRLGPPPLTAGAVLGGRASARAQVGDFLRPMAPAQGPVRVIRGPWADFLLGQPWVVTSRARSGLRLAGTGSTGVDAADGTSEPVLPGVIQVPPSGEPVILGRDGGVTGGYPIAATLITADVDRMAEIGLGQSVEFSAVSVERAAEIYAMSDQALQACIFRSSALS